MYVLCPELYTTVCAAFVQHCVQHCVCHMHTRFIAHGYACFVTSLVCISTLPTCVLYIGTLFIHLAVY